MMEVVTFTVDHLKAMTHQESNRGMNWLEVTETFKSLEGETSYSLLDGDTVLICAGMVEMHKGRGVAWAYLSDDMSLRTMAKVTKYVKEGLKSSKFNRIEMQVDCDFDKAKNWAKHLGFEMECERMKAFTPDKRDCALYAMVKT
jgi:hypothetical protein